MVHPYSMQASALTVVVRQALSSSCTMVVLDVDWYHSLHPASDGCRLVQSIR